jgi:hypothetical protein
MKSTHSRTLVLMVVLALAATGLASAEAYRVALHNGNEFVSPYRPAPAEYDETQMLIMTDQGNLIAIDEADIASITHDLEAKGFGRVIDTHTIEVGWSANLNPTAAEGTEEIPLQLQMMQMMQQMNTPQPMPTFNTPQFAEPNAGGGIPVGFTGMVTPPMGGGPQPIDN